MQQFGVKKIGYCNLAIAELKGRNYNVTIKKIIEPTTSEESKKVGMFTKRGFIRCCPQCTLSSTNIY